MDSNKTKNIILAVLVVGLVGMTIAYAALTQQLLITDNQVTVSSKWRIRFNETVTSTAGTGTTAVVDTPASITTGSDRTQISGLRATLKKPGDYVTVSFKVQNEGNIPAKGASTDPIVIGTPSCAPATGSTDVSGLCSLITYTVLKANGDPFSSADTLAAYSGTGDYPAIEGILKVELPSSVTAAQMEPYSSTDVVISGLTATFNYQQQ